MAEHWTIIDQTETTAKLPDSSYGRVVRVTFRTVAGTVGSVDVPAAAYTAENVRTAVDARVEQIHAVEAL